MSDDVNTAEEQQQYDWSAYYDENGSLYYYNHVTQESKWDEPEEGFNPPPPKEEEGEEGGDGGTAGASADADGAATSTEQVNDDDQQQQQQEQQPDQDESTEAAAATTNTSSTPWVAYKDDEGREYYFNTETQETSWDVPAEGFTQGDEAADQATGEEGDHEQDEFALGSPPRQGTPSPTGDLSPERVPSPMEEEEDDEPPPPEERTPTPEPEIDPEELKRQQAEEALDKPDSIMEMGVIDHVRTLLEQLGGLEGSKKVMPMMINNFVGHSAICGLYGQWTAELINHTQQQQSNTADAAAAAADNTGGDDDASTTTAGSSSQQATVSRSQNLVRETVQQVLTKLAKERFTKELGDEILKLKKSEAIFLDDMISSPQWRRLLIDLSSSPQKDSTLLKFCLRTISNQGHHREIIQRINPSDHFAVLNAMLASELAGLATTTMSSSVSSAASGKTTTSTTTTSSLDHVVLEDLLRTCSSTSYTYLYAIEGLRYLMDQQQQQQDAPSSTSVIQRHAIRKWLRFKEDLERVMMGVDSSGTKNDGSSSLFRKRRLDVALTMSELHQAQRRVKRKRSTTTKDDDGDVDMNGNQHEEEEESTEDSMQTALLTLLRKYALGMKPVMDDELLDKLLPTNEDATAGSNNDAVVEERKRRRIGQLLVDYPVALKALLENLFCPGRVSSLLTRAKCAHLFALGILTSEADAKKELGLDNNSGVSANYNDDDMEQRNKREEDLKGKLIQGSQACELLENMVSFTVSANPPSDATSAGMKLCRLALGCAPVALGVVTWALQVVRGPEFLTSASYPTLTPSILSLVRILARKHAFSRPDATQVALVFLGHSNPGELSSQKMRSLKEQALRLLMHLMVVGEVALVLRHVERLVAKKSLDSSLVRYFIESLLNVLQAPYSSTVTRSFGSLLLVPSCVEAIRSKFFGDVNKTRLKALIRNLPAQDVKEKKIVASLAATYGR